MYKRFIPLVLLSAAMIFAFSGCSRPFSQDQLHFGIEAAKKDLWDEAIFRWKRVLATDPNSAAAHNNLAVAYEKKGLWDEAKREYEIALKLKPENSYIKTNYQNFLRRYELIKKDENK
ncbi:MAG: tetratricopeptide repeat protein [Candidatus Aminicenantales bacterium]